MARYAAGSILCLFLPLISCWLRFVQGSGVLSTEELRFIFGDRNPVPHYSVLEPRVVGEGKALVGQGGGRYTRSAPRGPVLQFNALGRSFSFRLRPNHDLLSPNFVMIGRYSDKADIRDFEASRLDCYYQGVDETPGNSSTSIAVELCGHVRGVITSPTAEYVIEPLPEGVTSRRRRSTNQQEGESHTLYSHIIYARQDNTGHTVDNLSRTRRSFLATREEERAEMWSRPARRSYYDSYEHVVDSRIRSEWGDHQYDRYDRPYDGQTKGEDLYIETAVFVDVDLYRHMRENFPTDTEEQVLKVVLAMVNAVQLLYNDESLGHRVKFVLKRLEILYSDPRGLHRPYDIDDFLTNFCTWQRQENPQEDTDPLHWDHALILTGLDVYTITTSGRVNSQVVGLAPVAGMCTRSSSCTVNEGRHFESVYVMAHEIGHNLGMRHDGLQAGNNCDPGRYLMSPTLGSGKITWSPCSRRYLDVFLRSRQASCLKDVASPDRQQLNHEAHSLPGQRFSTHQQCMLKHGAGSHHAASQRLDEICQDLHCRRDHYTWTSHPALEGTTCGHRKWCRRGRCVEDSDAPGLPPPSSELTSSPSTSMGSSGPGGFGTGVGGEWGLWSECQSSCLYGVDGILSSGSSGLALSERRCRTCHGEYRYRVCSAVQECGTGKRKTLQDFAEETCKNQARNSAHLTGLAARLPDEGLLHCEVECETLGQGVQSSEKSYPDGTVCQSATSLPAFCVAGVCTEFRCDANTLYGADPLTCRPDMGAPDPHRPLGPQAPSHTTTRPLTPTTSGYDDSQWGPWRPASTCRFSCLKPAKGIQLVSRKCLERGCIGVNRNIQVCTPLKPECDRIRTPFEFASEVCARFKISVDQLSGVGMQLSSTKDDPDRSCTVACQDSTLNYRFYRVNGREGWFPFGTECSRGTKRHTRSYCLNGKCLDFSREGTPLRNTIYTEYERARSLDLEPIERAFPLTMVSPPLRRWISWRRRRDVTSSSHPISSTISDRLLLTLVDQVNHTLTTRGGMQDEPRSSIDFKNPLFVNQVPPRSNNYTFTLKPNTFTLTPLHPRPTNTSTVAADVAFDEEVLGPQEYQWRVTVSSCSVTCGTGLEEVMAVCTSVGAQEEAVDGSLCAPDPPPVTPHFRTCVVKAACLTHQPDAISSAIGRWLVGLLRDVSSSQV
ncbi:A disintegrin and metalloproteinase with thrombospondin motifs adt-1-like isoform X2 [Panulirus ornatus]|uniref:A disintegrin and metalloproteinase with thrombospondin motifs adt-1-like isoform X2 n=1 Tax=Panulirus ornatus TaxID=150431 RepID=UPI003A869622